MSTKKETLWNEIKPVPITDYNPLCEWQIDPCCLDVFNPECFLYSTATLVTGTSDIFSWVMSVIGILNSLPGNPIYPGSRPVYVKGDAWPSASPFLQLLQKKNRTFGSSEVEINLANRLMEFPIRLEDSPMENKVMFRWCIVNQEIPPWEGKKNPSSRLEKLLGTSGYNPYLIILDGFSWNGNMQELKKMLIRLKQRGISTMVLASKNPPNNFESDPVWDNILSISPWRSWRCSPDNIVLRFKKRNGIKMNIRHHLQSIDGVFWQEKFDGFDFLRPLVASWMRNDKTACQIVYLINSNPNLKLKRPMTTANLARLKREWGMRSYKPERKPRKPKTRKVQVVDSSAAQMNS